MLIYGKNPVKDFYETKPSDLIKVYVDKKRHQSFTTELERAGVKVFEYKEFRFNEEITGNENTQGIIAEITDPKNYSVKELIKASKDKKNPVFLILDRIEDPQNFGAILRNAAAFGVDGIIYPSRNAARLNSTTMKTSAGNWQKVKLSEVANLSNAIKDLKDDEFWIVSTSLEAEKSLDEIKDFDRPLAILLGNEGKGVRKALQEQSDFNIKIEMENDVESLNVSSSAAIILYTLYK